MLADKVIKRQIARDGFVKKDYVFKETNQTTTTLDCAVIIPGSQLINSCDY